MDKPSQPTPLAQILNQVLESRGLSARIKQHALFEQWEEIVGPTLADKTQPMKIQGKFLYIGVEHPAWIQELQFMKPKLLEKIQGHCPETTISDLRFVLKV